MQDQPMLIVGVNGKTGQRVQSRLESVGIPTRGVSRSTPIPFDWNQPDNWAAALEGTRAAYLTYHPDLSIERAEDDIRRFCESAKAAGLEHIVLLSGRGEQGANRAERVLRESAIDWNIVQASWFAQNFSESFFLDGVLAGEVVLPICDACEPFIDIDDIADVAVATLLEPGLHNRLFELTGPRCMTFTECVEAIAAETDYPVRITEVPLDAYIEALKSEDVPDYLPDLLSELFSALFDGRNAHITTGVQEALGRPATDFRDYARKAANSGVWNRPGERVA